MLSRRGKSSCFYSACGQMFPAHAPLWPKWLKKSATGSWSKSSPAVHHSTIFVPVSKFVCLATSNHMHTSSFFPLYVFVSLLCSLKFLGTSHKHGMTRRFSCISTSTAHDLKHLRMRVHGAVHVRVRDGQGLRSRHPAAAWALEFN